VCKRGRRRMMMRRRSPFLNHYKNDLKRHAHILSSDASADLKARARRRRV